MSRASLVPASFAIITLLALAVTFGLGVFPGVERAAALVPAGFALVMIAVIAGSVVVARRHAVNRSALALDAISRGFAFTPELRGWGLPGILFRAGEKVVATDLIDARATATPFIAGGMSGIYGSEESMQRPLQASFVAIPLERTVPNIVLLSTSLGVMKIAGIAVDPSQRLSLEGDFDTRFTLYCPTGYERDALEIFTPDFMQLLIDTTEGCDVELVDDWMFVYSRPGRYTIPGALDGLVTVTERVQAKLRRQTARYRDERSAMPARDAASGMRTVSPDEHAARLGRVAEKGSRVKTRASLPQRLVTFASSAFVAGAIIWYLVTEILPNSR